MSHSLHRTVSIDHQDYVIHVRSVPRINRQGSGDKIKSLIKLLQTLEPVAYGNPGDGCTLLESEEIVLEKFTDRSNLHITFADAGSFVKALRIILQEDVGLSVSVVGPVDQILEITEYMGMSPESILLDLGTFGREVNIEKPVQAIVSLCGHMRVAPQLVREMAVKVSSGDKSVGEASAEIGRVCRCGCFNTKVAADIISKEPFLEK